MKQTTSVNVSQRKQTMCGISQRCRHWKELWTSNNNKPIHRLQTRSPVQKSNNGSWTSKHVKETLGWQQTNVPTKTSQTCPLSTVAHRLEMTDATGRQPRRAPFWVMSKTISSGVMLVRDENGHMVSHQWPNDGNRNMRCWLLENYWLKKPAHDNIQMLYDTRSSDHV